MRDGNANGNCISSPAHISFPALTTIQSVIKCCHFHYRKKSQLKIKDEHRKKKSLLNPFTRRIQIKWRSHAPRKKSIFFIPVLANFHNLLREFSLLSSAYTRRLRSCQQHRKVNKLEAQLAGASTASGKFTLIASEKKVTETCNFTIMVC
jgi:hypothetical protein